MYKLSFRAWHKRLKTMEYFNDLYWFEENHCHSNGDGYELMLGTGLFDNTKQEIYDGDIVEFHPSPANPSNCIWTNLGHINIPSLSDGVRVCFNHPFSEMSERWADLLFNYYKGWDRTKEHLTLSVVGNIYQTPDLMEITMKERSTI